MEPAKYGAQTSPDLVHDAKDVAGKVVDQAKDFVGEQVNDKQEMAAEQISQVANALHRSSSELDDTFVGPYVKKAADALERVSDSVRNASLGDLVERTENFARKDPLLFIGGAFTLGLLAARFIKSSSQTSAGSAPKALTDGGSSESMSASPRRRSPRGSTPPMRGGDGNG